MAKSKEKSLGLLKYLTFNKEYREDGSVTPQIEGRFKHFRKVWSKHNGSLMVPNLLFLITLLPVLGLYVALQILGQESLSYKLFGSGNVQYFMANIGMGLSESSSLLEAKLNILTLNRFYYLFMAVATVFMSFGIAGMMHLAVKFVIGDKFVSKKDQYGNDVPKVVVEFFRGIKRYWLQMLIIGVAVMFLVAGISNAILFFVEQLWRGQAGAGEYILLILVCIIGVLSGMVLIHLVPTVVLYDMPFFSKVKNSCIFALQMFIPNLIVLAIIAAPILIITLTSGVLNILFIALILVFGSSFYSLLLANYEQYYSQNLVTKVYYAKVNQKGGIKGQKKK